MAVYACINLHVYKGTLSLTVVHAYMYVSLWHIIYHPCTQVLRLFSFKISGLTVQVEIEPKPLQRTQVIFPIT